MHEISIKDDVYEELVRVKGESESFSDIISDIILKLIKSKNFSMERYFGCLKDGDVLDKMEEYSRYIIKNNDVVTTVVYTTKY